jgi:hypothetical protein
MSHWDGLQDCSKRIAPSSITVLRCLKNKHFIPLICLSTEDADVLLKFRRMLIVSALSINSVDQRCETPRAYNEIPDRVTGWAVRHLSLLNWTEMTGVCSGKVCGRSVRVKNWDSKRSSRVCRATGAKRRLLEAHLKVRFAHSACPVCTYHVSYVLTDLASAHLPCATSFAGFCAPMVNHEIHFHPQYRARKPLSGPALVHTLCRNDLSPFELTTEGIGFTGIPAVNFGTMSAASFSVSSDEEVRP